MKKIVPFKKEIIFKTNLSEITSISLENTLKLSDNVVSGDFIVSGEYKVTDNSVDVEKFLYELPFSIAFDNKYDLTKASVDINDFYYEIINNGILSVNIEVLVDNIEENIVEEVSMNSVRELEEVEDKRCIEEEDRPIIEEAVEKIDIEENELSEISLFDNISIEDTYKTYKVYIVRENDTLENILEKYNVTKDLLDSYNDLSEIKLGNKIVIPIIDEGN